MTTRDTTIAVDIPHEAAEDLADGYVLVVAGDTPLPWQAILAGVSVFPDQQILLHARLCGVPVIRLSTQQLLDLIRRRPVELELHGVRYQIAAGSVDDDEWLDDED
jgi:hypothetical protein